VIRTVVRVAVLAAVIALLAGLGPGASAQEPASADAPRTPTAGQVSGESITLETNVVQPGQRILITFNDWQARTASIVVCANLAKRGSADCNQVQGQGVTISGLGKTGPVASFVVNPPAGTCPCLIKATGLDSDESAVAPIEIIGHPTGPIVDPFTGDLIAVTMEPERAAVGLLAALRSELGGPTEYDVTVTVENLTTETLLAVDIFGSVGRSATEDLDIFEMVPGELGPGLTWTGEARVTLPSPVYGDYRWEVVASGAGPVVRAEETIRVVPWLLLLLILVLVGDLTMILVRYLQRRRRRADDQLLADADPPDDGDWADEEQWVPVPGASVPHADLPPPPVPVR
jgi:hypothetical protein